ncbi:valine--tRNA ligase [Candidatus Daviesbacteria bacterium]|nr:valine--tRNA ligase [Candidatus Daviesbacteria bacterium]
MDKVYKQNQVEQKWYKFWEENGFFKPEINPSGKPYVITMPPPNVTGELHLGHALTASIEDLLIRYHRMKGEAALWIPGVDHAGIATQVVVEKELAKEGKTRHDLGKDEFLKRVWGWVKKYGQRIDEQHKKLGVSADWSRRRFTMDDDYQEAVQEAFNRLKRKDLIYQDTKITSWCSRCSTVLSDLESIYKEERAKLYYLDYGSIQIATTRPETIFADVAVAVPPKKAKAKVATIPLINLDIPIIEDGLVDPKFGTGALKITPAHDPLDFQIWQKHKSQIKEFPVVINADGLLVNDKRTPKEFTGLKVAQAKESVVESLKKAGKLIQEENITHSVAHCQRCDTVIEPMVSLQWFIKMQPLAKPAISAVKSGQIKIIPKRFEKVYFQWLENIQDWCISRQIWWGHEILEGGDVLDTWFSSSLWPFATLGWPKETEDLKYFYPTTVMETGYDILFFWVARMIMMGLEMTDQAPFQTVYLHGLIRDPLGQKMSKSKGNVIEPLLMADKYGTDALRMSLVVGNTPGKDMRLSEPKIQGMRNFTNKLWNIGRFIIDFAPDDAKHLDKNVSIENKMSNPADREILDQLSHTIQSVTESIEKYRFHDAAEALYEFIWHQFADKYIESTKNRRTEAQPVLEYVFRTSLELLHPFMPFITEELWQGLPHQAASIMVTKWPSGNNLGTNSRKINAN